MQKGWLSAQIPENGTQRAAPSFFIAHISVETLLEKETLGKEDMRRLPG